MTELQFFECLRPRFAKGEYALVPQVRNGTGFQKRTRTADALAVSLWPSRGVEAHGFEFKDSRADWLRELKDPAKAEEIGRYCAFWWVVISDPKVVARDELPPAWGLLHAADGGTKVIVKAPRRPAQEPGWPFVAAVLRAAEDTVTGEDVLQRRIKAAVEAAQAKSDRTWEKMVERAKRDSATDSDRLRRSVAAFEEASGLKIDAWQEWASRELGEAVAVVRALNPDGLARWATAVAKNCRDALALAEQLSRIAHDPALRPGSESNGPAG